MKTSEVREIDAIEVSESNCVHVRTKVSLIEGGIAIESYFHRHFVRPCDDYSKEHDRVQAVCAGVFTPEVIQSWLASYGSV